MEIRAIGKGEQKGDEGKRGKWSPIAKASRDYNILNILNLPVT